MVNQFVHLKTKSHYSILESSIKVDDLIDKAAQDNMTAIALTDTNNLFGAMEFTKKALEKKIKPILGANILIEWHEKPMCLTIPCSLASSNVFNAPSSEETLLKSSSVFIP